MNLETSIYLFNRISKLGKNRFFQTSVRTLLGEHAVFPSQVSSFPAPGPHGPASSSGQWGYYYARLYHALVICCDSLLLLWGRGLAACYWTHAISD